MAVTFHTLTGDVTDVLGVDFPLDRVTGATLETNLARDQALVAGSSVRLPGVGKVDVQADGTFSVGNLVASDSADTNIDPETPLLYRVNIRYRHPQAQRSRNVVDVPVWSSPWFELNGSGTTTLANVIEVAYLPASLISQATATLEAARDDAVADVQAATTGAVTARNEAEGFADDAEGFRDESETFRNQQSAMFFGDAEAAFDGYLGARNLPEDGAALLAQTVAPSQIDVRRFLLPGETLPNQGDPDDPDTYCDWLMARAHMAVAAMCAADGRPRQVGYPEGDWVYKDFKLDVYDKVGIVGAGDTRTRFVQVGQSVLQYGNLVGETGNVDGQRWLEDNVYEHFWVDSALQDSADGEYESLLKAMVVQMLRRPRFLHLRTTDSIASQMGLDFIEDGWMDHCHLTGSGRKRDPSNVSGTGANLGYGVGRSPDEHLLVTNTYMADAYNNNVYVERLDPRLGEAEPTPITPVGSRALTLGAGTVIEGSPIGVTFCGSVGAKVEDALIRYRNTALAFRKAGMSPTAGRDVHVLRTTLEQRGTQVPSGNTGIRSAVHLGITDEPAGGLIMEDITYVGLSGSAVVADGNTNLSHGGVTFRGYHRGTLGGRLFRLGAASGKPAAAKVHAAGADFSGLTYVGDLISIGHPVVDLRVERNTVKGGGAFGQAGPLLSLDAGVTTTVPPRVKDNTGVAVPTMLVGVAALAQDYVAGNYSTFPTPLYADTFTRANSSAIGNTETGRASSPAAWAPLPSGNGWVIDANSVHRDSTSGTGGGVLVIDAGHASGLVQGRLGARSGSPTTGGLVFRVQDQSNYLQLSPYGAGNTYKVSKIVAGTETVIATTTVAAVFDGTHLLWARMDGDAITVYVNGTVLWTGTITDFNTATKHGFRGHTTWNRWDDFAFWEAAVVPAVLAA